MSSKENNEVAVEKLDNEKNSEGKHELKGTKRAAEVSTTFLVYLVLFIVLQFGTLFRNIEDCVIECDPKE